MEQLPTRSPMPSAVAWTRSTPEVIAVIVLIRPRPRSLWPCQSILTSTPVSWMIWRT